MPSYISIEADKVIPADHFWEVKIRETERGIMAKGKAVNGISGNRWRKPETDIYYFKDEKGKMETDRQENNVIDRALKKAGYKIEWNKSSWRNQK